MKLLIVGGGGREHTLAWKVSLSARVDQVNVAPGNAGTALEPKVENVAISPEDIPALVSFARDREIGLAIIGPEAPLVAGIVDAFEAAGLRCLGPNRAAAILEGSKAYAKAFMLRHQIPTAPYQTFTDLDRATAYIRAHATPIVVKADGLAAGKGVVIAHDQAQAIEAARDMLSRGVFGAAGREIVIEGFLRGEEASFVVVTDGTHALPLASSQDHKARNDGDTGPNTGGMGAYSPAPVVTKAVQDRIMREVIGPTIRGMAEEGRPYRGFLYAGLMIQPDGTPTVLEYNCRLGDPETQPIMMRLRSDLVPLCEAIFDGGLAEFRPQWEARAALGVVLIASAYPGSCRRADVITGLDANSGPDIKVFHAGTRLHEGHVVTAGGRVLCVCALGDNVTSARKRAYERVAQLHWEGMHYRLDIGHRAIAREASSGR